MYNYVQILPKVAVCSFLCSANVQHLLYKHHSPNCCQPLPEVVPLLICILTEELSLGRDQFFTSACFNPLKEIPKWKELSTPMLGSAQSTYVDVSKNRGTPESSILIGFFHYKPSILGYPYFWKHPNDSRNSLNTCHMARIFELPRQSWANPLRGNFIFSCRSWWLTTEGTCCWTMMYFGTQLMPFADRAGSFFFHLLSQWSSLTSWMMCICRLRHSPWLLLTSKELECEPGGGFVVFLLVKLIELSFQTIKSKYKNNIPAPSGRGAPKKASRDVEVTPCNQQPQPFGTQTGRSRI